MALGKKKEAQSHAFLHFMGAEALLWQRAFNCYKTRFILSTIEHLSLEKVTTFVCSVCHPPSQFYVTKGIVWQIAKLDNLSYVKAPTPADAGKCLLWESQYGECVVVWLFVCVCVNMVDMGKEEPPTLTGWCDDASDVAQWHQYIFFKNTWK